MNNYKLKLVSSLEKVTSAFPEETADFNSGSMLKNEQYSFQVIIQPIVDEWYAHGRIEIESPIKEYITPYVVGDIPCMYTHLPNEYSDDDFITKVPAILPDQLYPMTDNSFEVLSESVVRLWLTVEPKSRISGEFDIDIIIYDTEDNVIGRLTHKLNIIDCELPKQKLIATCWFHGDAIAAVHNVEVGSEKYWDYTKKYLEAYTRFGYNTILTPIFTPPLDTDVGAERLTNQLVDVNITNGKYSFGFSRLDYWIDLCHSYGMEYFEISHLFTQWGAEFTPKIMATVDGEYKRIFGWDVAALSDEYTGFLGELLPALVNYLKSKGIYESCYFHISDEPNEKHLVQYEKVSKVVQQYIDFDRMIDALSDYDFYEKGLVNIPVAANDHIDPFLDRKVENLWTYYCGCQGNKVSNRCIAMPSYRNRVLGWQLYKYNIKGFLNWGYNFWFSTRARKTIDPYYTAPIVLKDREGSISGDSFCIYPINESGEVVPSLRAFVFNEGLQDMRALELLERLTDRETTDALLVEINRFDTYPRNAEFYLKLRQEINKRIAEAL